MEVQLNGEWVDFDAAVNLMDDEIREYVHSCGNWFDEQSFMDEYARLHPVKYDQDFVVN